MSWLAKIGIAVGIGAVALIAIGIAESRKNATNAAKTAADAAAKEAADRAAAKEAADRAAAKKNSDDLGRIAKEAKAKADAAAKAKSDYDQGVRDGDAFCERAYAGAGEAPPSFDKLSKEYKSGWDDGFATCKNRHSDKPPEAIAVTGPHAVLMRRAR
jgi:hypothetical protein